MSLARNPTIVATARDGIGCEITQVVTNTRDLDKDLWIGAANYVTATTQLATPGTIAIATGSQYLSQFEVNNNTTTWEAYVTTNELARLRDGTAANPNNLRLFGHEIEQNCPVVIDWQADVREAHTLSGTDRLDVFLEFKDASGAVIEKRQVEQPPAGGGRTLGGLRVD